MPVDTSNGAPVDVACPRLLDLHPAEPSRMLSLRVLSPPDVVTVAAGGMRACSARAWGRALGAVICRLPGDDLPDAAMRAHVQPLAYQWVPLLALRSGRTRRLLLADEVGMGKTVQAGLVLAEIHDRMAAARTLTVVPAGLVGQWNDELRRRFALSPTLLDSAVLASNTAAAPGDPAASGDACIISLDTLRLPEVTTLLERCDWQLLVVDEAHLLASGSARLEAITRLARRASRVLLLTATPFTGDEARDRSLLSVGQRTSATGGDRMLVVARRAATLGRPPASLRVAWVSTDVREDRLHAQLNAYVERALRDTHDASAGRLAAYLLRRRACSSIAALATSVRRRIDVLGTVARHPDAQLWLPLADEADADEEWLRAPAWSDMDAERACLDAIADAALACDDAGAKLRWLVRWLGRCREPVLVFTEYADTLRALRRLLSSSRRVTCIYGAQTNDQRQMAIHQFCSGDADVLLATDAAAEGLNLHQRCRLVVHVDVPWSPRRLAQRNGRLDRIGQTRPVRATILAARGTHDRDVLRRLVGRQQLVESARAGSHRDLATCSVPRREQVAHEALRRSLIATAQPARRHSDDALRAWLRPRRWRQIVDRLGLPAGCRAIVLAELGLEGAHPLVRSRLWVAGIAHEDLRATGFGTGAMAPWRSVTRLVRRGRIRSARFDALDAATRAAAPARLPRDLFGAEPAVPGGDIAARHSSTAVTIQLLAVRVLSCRR